MKFLNTRISSILLVFSVFIFTLLSCNNKPTDESIQNQINDSLQANENYKGVNAAVADGVVTLNGECSGENCADEIENKIKGIDGVQSIENNVSAEIQTTDFTLRTQVQSVIINYQGVNADVSNGVIILRGSIERSRLQPLMTELNALRPTKIDNQLAVN